MSQYQQFRSSYCSTQHKRFPSLEIGNVCSLVVIREMGYFCMRSSSLLNGISHLELMPHPLFNEMTPECNMSNHCGIPAEAHGMVTR